MNKQSLRQGLRAERLRLSSNDVQEKSAVIVEQVWRLADWASVQRVHCFSSITEQNEPDTHDIFEFIWDTHPHIKTYTTQKVGTEWLHGQLSKAGFDAVSTLPFLDIIFVPCLGFDSVNNRLGYGGGFYDKFLATQPEAQKIGLCFESGRVARLPVEPHDIKLDMVITETKQ